MSKYAIGLDYGTNSCRSLIVNLNTGKELASHVYAYPSGTAGILLDPHNPNVARQNPQDYLDGLIEIVTKAITKAKQADSEFNSNDVIGIGIDTTGSTPIPVDRQGVPLAFSPEFKNNLDAKVWLWKDHTAFIEADSITQTAKTLRPHYLEKCGGTYSSEWFWSKVWRIKNVAPDVFNAAYSFVEHCDYLPAVLTGNTNPDTLLRSVCAAGHKAMYSDDWGGLPDKEFLTALDPDLAELRDRLYQKAYPSDKQAGRLCKDWATILGLPVGTSIAVGAFDAHMGGVGAGIKEGTLVKILGTSTCDMMVMPETKKLGNIPGVCGVVKGSILPDAYGIEAGQSAVGDIFLWFVNNLVPDSYGKNLDEKFINLEKKAKAQKPGAHGLLALDWNNGNRTILVDVQLTGLILGQSLYTEAHEIYRALVEATAFGALTIINRIEEHGVPVKEIINCGGLADKNEMLMQIYADVTGRPMKVAKSDQTCALGSALFGAVSAGSDISGFASLAALQENACAVREKVYSPISQNHEVYKEIYALYKQLHDGFGTREWNGNMRNIMKKLISIRAQQRG